MRLVERHLIFLADTDDVRAQWRRLVTTHRVQGVQVHDARLETGRRLTTAFGRAARPLTEAGPLPILVGSTCKEQFMPKVSLPIYEEEMQRELQALTGRLTEEALRWTHRLDGLSKQIEEALRRAETSVPPLSDGALADAPWALEALSYLEKRQQAGAAGACPIPELFAALKDRHSGLSVTDFHDRLRRLRDRRALQLLPFAGAPNDIPEPEYALLDGSALLYYVAR